MAQKALITVDGTHHKIKKALVTVDGVHHRIKKAFITVGGVYRPCWDANSGSSGTLTYWGTAEMTLSGYSNDMSGVEFNGKAVFRHGTTIDYYDSGLTRYIVPHATPQAGSKVVVASDYIMFGGGLAKSATTSETYMYDNEFSRIYTDSFYEVKTEVAATSVGEWILFSNGRSPTSYDYVNYVDAYNVDTGEHRYWEAFPLDDGTAPDRSSMGATSVGDYALFAGGSKLTKAHNGVTYYIVEAYTKNLSLIRGIDNLSSSASEISAATVGNHALFAGGTSYNSNLKTSLDSVSQVVGYDRDGLERIIPDKRLPKVVSHLATATLSGFAVFGGGAREMYGYSGQERGTTARAEVTAYQKDTLVRIIADPLSECINNLAAATVDNYLLFSGGEYLASLLNKEEWVLNKTVDVYTIV